MDLGAQTIGDPGCGDVEGTKENNEQKEVRGTDVVHENMYRNAVREIGEFVHKQQRCRSGKGGAHLEKEQLRNFKVRQQQ